jgi:acyl-[acyl-carrier-protein] desaturase
MASKEHESARIEQRITPPDVLAHRNELVRSLDDRAGELADKYLLPEEKLWFPDKFIPPSLEGKIDLRDREGVRVPRLLAVVLVGNGITEDGLSMFETMLNRAEGMADDTGADDTGHAKWSRGWTAEELRHGRVIRSYLECVPTVNLAAVDRIQHKYIAGGFDPGIRRDPYRLVVYPSMQEPATETPHKRTGHTAHDHELLVLAKTSIQVGSDEGRHGNYYADMGREIIALDPEGFIDEYHYIAHERMMVMPGANMDGFDVFMNAAIAMDMYGPADYVKIAADLNKRWDLEHLSLSGAADEKREILLRKYTHSRAERLREKQTGRKKAAESLLGARIPWLMDPVITQADLAEVGLAA